MENTVHIKIANLAVNLQCNIFVDKFGDICLLRKFYNDEGVNIKKCDEYSFQSSFKIWIK